MRELIIRCDHCGKVIEGNPYKVRLEQEDRDTEEFITNLTEEQQKVGDMDWCENCFRNLTAFLLDTSHKLLVAPPIQEEASQAAAVESASESESSEEDPERSGGKRRKEPGLTYEADWPAKKIADEFGVTEGAVWNAVHRMKKQEEKDEKVQ